MKKSIVSCLVLAITVGFAAGSWARSADKDFKIVEITESVIMAQNPSGSNITCIALSDGLVFVDTGLLTEAAWNFRQEMEQRFKRPTTHLFLTHAHLDHIFAMGAFADVEVVAAEAARPLFEHQLAIEWNEKTIEGYTNVFPTFAKAQKTARPFMPTVWVESERSFGPTENGVIFANTGGHSSGSSYVYFPSQGVLVGGDLVQVDKCPYFGDQTTDLQAWIDTLKAWYDMAPSRVCPGHGRAVEKDYLKSVWEYFEDLRSTLRALKAEGVPAEEAVIHPSLPAGYWDGCSPEPRWFKYCIALTYRNI